MKGTSSAVIRREHDLTKGAKRTILVDPFGGIVTEGNFTMKIDEVDENTIYIGSAQIGSSPSSPVWQIRKIIINGTETSILWAEGTDEFNQVWNNRTSLSYF